MLEPKIFAIIVLLPFVGILAGSYPAVFFQDLTPSLY
jgi:hypothetical protein